MARDLTTLRASLIAEPVPARVANLLAHHLNNPLAVVKSTLDYLREALGILLTADMAEALSESLEACAEIGEVVEAVKKHST